MSNPFAPPDGGSPPGKPHRPVPPRPEGKRKPGEDRAERRKQLIKQIQELPQEQRDKLVKLNRLVVYFGLAAIGAFFALQLPLPWPAMGVWLLVLAVVIAIRGLIKAKDSPLAQGAKIYLTMGLVMCGFFSLYAAGLAVAWPQQWSYQQCAQAAQTVQGADACKNQLQQSTENMFSRLLKGK